MKRHRRNKLEVYIESFLMTVGFAVTLADFPSDIAKFELPAVYAEDDLVTLDASGEGVDIEVVFGEDGIKELVKEEVDAKMDEYQTQVVGVVTPVETNTNDYDESKNILDEQFETIAEGVITAEINSGDYSGMKLSHEFEDFIKGLCLEYSEKYDIDYNKLYKVMLTIGYRESAGEWNNNGVWSKTNDLGKYQINVCNLPTAKDVLGYTAKDLQFNKYKCATFAAYQICTIINNPKCQSEIDIYGMYNGWTSWRNKPSSVNYARGCIEIENEYFSELENSKSK